MSEFRVEVVEIGPIVRHPNADTLSTTFVNGYPVILRTGDYEEGQRAVYVPIDSVVPAGDSRWSFLEHRRIKAKRLRGIFSMGLLTRADPSWSVGEDVRERLGIEKYVSPTESGDLHAANDRDPGICPVYDIEGFRRYRNVFVEGEEVWISEKIHGQNARFVHDGERLHIGSHTKFKVVEGSSTWNVVAERYKIAEKLAEHPGIAIYGETYGNNADMPYGVKRPEGDRLVLFDALDTKTRRWFDVEEFHQFATLIGLPTVPTLYRGPWNSGLASLAEGQTTLGGATHVREGIVIKPLVERSAHMGRVFLKLAGEGYLLRKNA